MREGTGNFIVSVSIISPFGDEITRNKALSPHMVHSYTMGPRLFLTDELDNVVLEVKNALDALLHRIALRGGEEEK